MFIPEPHSIHLHNGNKTVGSYNLTCFFFSIIYILAPSSILKQRFCFCSYCCHSLFLDFIQGQNRSLWHKGETSRFPLSKYKCSSDTEHGSFSPYPGLLHRHRRADSRISVWLNLVKYWRKMWQPASGKPQMMSQFNFFSE